MPTRDRLPPWHERHRLPNGREVLVRPVKPNDAAPMLAGLELLEPDPVRSLLFPAAAAQSTLERLVRPDPRTEFVLVATDLDPPGEAVVAAIAHARNDPTGQWAEFHILVSRFITGLGISRYLLTRVVKWARSRRIGVLEGVIPIENQPLLDLASTLGFRRVAASQPSDPTLARVRLQLIPA